MAEIIIGKDNRCTCSCGDKCIINKIGSQPRCTKEEIETVGYKTIQLILKRIGIIKRETVFTVNKDI